MRRFCLEAEAIGGQAGTSSMIRNYLGFPRGISGMRLAQRARGQALRFGTRFFTGWPVIELLPGADPAKPLTPGELSQLVEQCRAAKERHEATTTDAEPGFTDRDQAMFGGEWSWILDVVHPALAAGPAAALTRVLIGRCPPRT